jgi:hypothetical protein
MAFNEFEVTAAPKVAEGKGKMLNDEPVQVYDNSPPPTSNDLDCEKHGASRQSNPLPDLKRKLKSRHLQMIAIGESYFDSDVDLEISRPLLIHSGRRYYWHRSFHQ